MINNSQVEEAQTYKNMCIVFVSNGIVYLHVKSTIVNIKFIFSINVIADCFMILYRNDTLQHRFVFYDSRVVK